jgi:hypothetical protein
MATLTNAGDSVSLTLSQAGETAAIALSGTYDMIVLVQVEQGAVGSGSWQTLKRYATANATVSDAVYSTQAKQRFRIIVDTASSGSLTATLTDASDVIQQVITDDNGNPAVTITQAGTTVEGNLTVDGTSTLTGAVAMASTLDVTGATTVTGSLVGGPSGVVLTAATDLTRAAHAFRPIILNNATGFKVRLPDATGSGDQYHFYVGALVTSGSHEINAFEIGADIINGVVCAVDAPGDEFIWGAKGTENMISLGGTDEATGGSVGDYICLTDIAAGVWSAQGFLNQDGTEATPFGTDS